MSSVVSLSVLLAWIPARAQQAPPTPRAQAPVDLTGYWVSVITEDWRWRMVTPAKGDFIGLPLNAEGQKATQAWDYQKDMAAGNQCLAYGAGGIFRLPTRLHITWDNDTTLKIETDAGQQTKTLHFAQAQAPAGPRSLQGSSVAEWVDVVGAGGGGRGGRGGGAAAGGAGRAAPPAFGAGGLRVVTTNLKNGYVRKNGVPYSENAVVTEYFDRVPGPGNAQWLIVKTIVEDPTYWAQPLVTSSQFKLEPDGSKWNPGPCQIDPPLAPDKPERPR